jgi:hypothetical protein
VDDLAHPAQRSFVDKDFAGPARITDSAGTGKTVVALHRAVRLPRADPAARVLLTTYNGRLAEGIRAKLALLAAPRNVSVADLRPAALAEHERLLGPVRVATAADVHAALEKAADGATVDPRFLRDEWRLIVDARDVRGAATYRDLPRHGRRTRLTGDRRDAMWEIFARVRTLLHDRGLKTYAEALHDTAAALAVEGKPPFDHIVVDEAQDLSLPELRFLKSACAGEINGLFFAGDIGQRIFRPPFAWSAEGIEIRGRSRSLKVNYRTSRQIRRRADLLLPPRLLELDGAEEDRTGVQSVFDGPAPVVRAFPTAEAEIEAVTAWIAAMRIEGIRPEEIGVLVRSIDVPARRARHRRRRSGSPCPRRPRSPPHPAGSPSPPCTPPRASSSAPSQSWPATQRSPPPNAASSKPPTKPPSRKFTPPSATSSTSPSPRPATTSSSPVTFPSPSFFRTSLIEPVPE